MVGNIGAHYVMIHAFIEFEGKRAADGLIAWKFIAVDELSFVPYFKVKLVREEVIGVKIGLLLRLEPQYLHSALLFPLDLESNTAGVLIDDHLEVHFVDDPVLVVYC